MTISEELKRAYFHHRKNAPRANRYTGFDPAGRHATIALEAARGDVASGQRRYASSPWKKPYPAVSWQKNEHAYRRDRIAHVDKPEAAGLRLVAQVMPESSHGTSIWHNGGFGWISDPYGDVFKDGSGLCYGVVYQLPGRDGKARFVAGYQFGGTDGGPTIDFSEIFEETTRPVLCTYQGYQGKTFTAMSGYEDNPLEMDAARDAARCADSMAESAAEKEREYQTAWQAGQMWSDAGDGIAAARKSALEIMKERREARKDETRYPAICAALKSKLESILDDIREARDKRAKLAGGDYDGLIFYPSDDLKAAFCDGADLQEFPA